MTTLAFDHVNIRTTNLDAMMAWYEDVLGMKVGPRPNFSMAGAWLYLGDQPVVHLVGMDALPDTPDNAALRLEHFALRGDDRAGFEAKLEARGERFQTSEVHDFGFVQYNVWDPDGNHIHVDFNLD